MPRRQNTNRKIMSKGKPTVKAFKAPSPSPCSAQSLFPFGGRGMKTRAQARTQATTWAPVHSPRSRQCPWVQARCLPKVPSSCINREDTSQAGLQLKPRRATGPKSRLARQNKTLTVPTQCQGKASLPAPGCLAHKGLTPGSCSPAVAPNPLQPWAAASFPPQQGLSGA